MSTDFRWMSAGGILLDGNGDIATTIPGTLESLQDMVNTRLKAAIDGWKLYRIGADLQDRLGDTVDAELEITLRRQVIQALSSELLPRGSFRVETLTEGNVVSIFVYLSETLLATATLTREGQITVQ